MREMPNLPAVDYCCTFDPQDSDMGCICGASERVLRAVKLGKASLASEQREWCLSEIGSVEGYDRREHEGSTDGDLAQSVLSAWTDYAEYDVAIWAERQRHRREFDMIEMALAAIWEALNHNGIAGWNDWCAANAAGEWQ